MMKTNGMSALAGMAVVVSGALVLAACDRQGQSGAEQTAPEPVVAAPPTQSIIRPDADIVREEPEEQPLEPLTLVIPMADGTELSEAAQADLATVLSSEQATQGGRIVLRGHSDSAGSDAANLRASQLRAEAVRNWLVERGIIADRIAVIPLGEQNPIAPNAQPDGTPNEAGRAANRRVELTIEVPPDSDADQVKAEPPASGTR